MGRKQPDPVGVFGRHQVASRRLVPVKLLVMRGAEGVGLVEWPVRVRATKAAEAAVACPLLEGIDLSGARGVLVLTAANKANFQVSESRAAMNTIRRYAADDAHLIFGAAYDDSLGDQLRVTVIATGLSRARPAGRLTPLTVFLFTHVRGISNAERHLAEHRRLRVQPERTAPSLTAGPSSWLITLSHRPRNARESQSARSVKAST